MAFRCDDPLADEPDFAGQESRAVDDFQRSPVFFGAGVFRKGKLPKYLPSELTVIINYK